MTAPDMVTVVIQHALRPHAAPAYEEWLARIIPVAGRFPGHRGVHVIRPADGAGDYTVTLRFDDLDAAQDWMRSDARRNLLADVEPLLAGAEKISTVTGLEFWFTAPAVAGKKVPPWKQFVMALSVLYPLTFVVPWAIAPLVGAVPFLQQVLLHHLLDVGLVVCLMTWVVMPRYTRLVARWLYR